MQLIESGGGSYPQASRFVESVEAQIEKRREERDRVLKQYGNSSPRNLKEISEFRADTRYGNDGTRIDLAYAIYALAHGASVGQVEAALRSRDLSHKGAEKRKADYVARTIGKARLVTDKGRAAIGR